MDYMIGRGAISTAGHDFGKCYVIYSIDDEYVYLVDGIARNIKNPKKKNKKHVDFIEGMVNLLPDINDNNIITRNEDIKRAIKTYSKLYKGVLPR